MPNNVRNVITVFGSAEHQDDLLRATQALIEKLKIHSAKEALWGKSSVPDDFDQRTKINSDNGRDLDFLSAWSPCHPVQDRIALILSGIDPKVVVQNGYDEEAYSPVGCRLVTIADDQIEEYYSDRDLNDQTEDMEEEPEDGLADLVEGALRETEKEAWDELCEEFPSSRALIKVI